jgi:hypothetical protein
VIVGELAEGDPHQPLAVDAESQRLELDDPAEW